jgi:subtilisin family serine protease
MMPHHHLAKLFRALAGLSLLVAALGAAAPAAPAKAGAPLAIPAYTQLVENAGADVTGVQPGSLISGPVSVIVHINMSPLAMVGRQWDHQQRLDYVAQIRAAQDALIPQIEALGGAIAGRLTHLSTGLAVEIDASQLDELRQLGNVIGVHGVNNYALDLTETVDWIGGGALQDLGITGDGVDVAVLDSGIDYTHIKLGGSGLVADFTACYATNTTVGDCLFYPNAKVVGGWDWVGESWPTLSSSISPDPDPIARAGTGGHGTHVADIIGGLESAPGAGDAGVAPGTRIWAFKVCSARSSSCNGLALLLGLDDAMDLDDSDYGACTPGVDPGCLAYDPADVVNMSLGSIYGQPEDDLTLFSNIASYYGSLVVASAGNSGDRPYIVGSPSTADAALSVAQSTVPSDKLYIISTGGASANGLHQPWSGALSAISGTLVYDATSAATRIGCTTSGGASPWVGTPFAGQVVLMDRGLCAVSMKVANAQAAGAVLAIIANNAFSNTPPTFSYGGGVVTIPGLTITLNEGNALKATALGTTASVTPASFIALQDDIVATSSRGPRVNDGDIKPDIAAPGASVSAEVGTGTGKTAFGGTSGAAPMVSGSAALIIERFEDDGLLDSDPGLDGLFGSYPSAAPVLKSLLMNTANPNTKIGGSFLAPITLQGAGRVDALAAYDSGTLAMDVTDIAEWLFTGTDAPCGVTPVADVMFYVLFGIPPDCADDYPYGNDFFNAWNSITGSLSFGYDGYSTSSTSESRLVLLVNMDGSSHTYNLSSAFRYANDANTGVSLTATPSSVTIPSGGAALIIVTLNVNAKYLRHWTLNAGQFGASGTNIFCSNPNPQVGCPTLQMFEADGFLTIDGGEDNTVRMPWQVLPKKAAETFVSSVTSTKVKLKNPANYKAGDTDVFSLVDINPNNCEIVDGGGGCVEANYVPGILPGVNATAIDIHEVGVREYQVPGLNAALGLPAAPYGAINDEVIDFGITVYDKPYRASHNFPIEFDIYVDSNADGVDDYVVFNYDLALTGGDGRNAVFVCKIGVPCTTATAKPYFFSFTDFNSQNWILPVPAAAIGVVSNKPFKFFVLAFDAYFTGDLWDCSPFNGGVCGGAYHKYQTGLPKFQPAIGTIQVPKNGTYSLSYTKPAGGASKSPSQIGLLFLYRDAKVGAESSSVILP